MNKDTSSVVDPYNEAQDFIQEAKDLIDIAFIENRMFYEELKNHEPIDRM